MFRSFKARLRKKLEKMKGRFLRTAKRKELLRMSCLIRACIDGSKRQVLVVSFNNGTYVSSMVDQLNNLGLQPIVIDNCSSSRDSVELLGKLECTVIYSKYNFGHDVGFRSPVYEALPDFFGYTDPDIRFSSALPVDFFDELVGLTETYSVYKAGFALRIATNDDVRMKHPGCRVPFKAEQFYTVEEWERRYWLRRIIHPTLEIYSAPVDTTFAVYSKRNFKGDFFEAVRVAGDYIAIHLPWHPDLDIMSEYQRSEYRDGNVSNTWGQ